MKHSQTTNRIIGIVAAVILGGLVLLWPMQAFAQPGIPHPIDGREDCLSCHDSGASGIPQIPESHADYDNDVCQGCHAEAGAEAAGGAPAIPHELEGREDCTACHRPAAEVIAAVQPTATPAAIPTPIAYPQPEGGANTCLDCHLGLGEPSEQMIADWESSIHAESDVICSDCHGGDPNAEDMAAAMSADAGYIGVPDRTDIPGLCGSCHSDVEQMRQYNLPTDQLDKYWESEHGLALAGGDTRVATCFDCHDHHATRTVDDPSSDAYFLNVPALCATCHEDPEYMAAYDIPTDQFTTYQGSVHGVALLENQDVRAPSCASCHSRHGASPPGIDEVANVCGSCHTATQDYYEDGEHAIGNPEAPRCITCHGYHNILVTGDEMFLGDQPGSCQSCHAPGSERADAVTAIYDSLTEANEDYDEAEATVERAMRLGMIMAEEEALLANSRTSLITARAAQHTVNLETVSEETDAAIDFSRQAIQQAEEAIGQSEIRRMAMVIALVVIAIIVFALLLLRRELKMREQT